jgi:RNA polymerase sigma-70 factor (ECF subfamily)
MTNLAVPQPDVFGRLIFRFAAGDRVAFEDFYRMILPAARAVATRILRDSHLAEDALQEASRKAWMSAPRFRAGNGRAWFLTIVRNTSLNMLAARSRADVTPAEDIATEIGRFQERVTRGDGSAVSLDEAAYLAGITREPWFRALARRDQQIVVLAFLGFSNSDIMRLLPDVTHNEIIRRALARAAKRWPYGDGTVAAAV